MRRKAKKKYPSKTATITIPRIPWPACSASGNKRPRHYNTVACYRLDRDGGGGGGASIGEWGGIFPLWSCGKTEVKFFLPFPLDANFSPTLQGEEKRKRKLNVDQLDQPISGGPEAGKRKKSFLPLLSILVKVEGTKFDQGRRASLPSYEKPEEAPRIGPFVIPPPPTSVVGGKVLFFFRRLLVSHITHNATAGEGGLKN